MVKTATTTPRIIPINSIICIAPHVDGFHTATHLYVRPARQYLDLLLTLALIVVSVAQYLEHEDELSSGSLYGFVCLTLPYDSVVAEFL